MKRIIYNILMAAFLAVPSFSYAQLSLSTGANWTRYAGEPSSPDLYGFDLRMGIDFGVHSQVSGSYTWNAQYAFQRLETPVHELNWNVPQKVDNPNNRKFGEWSFLYTNYFLGDNVTFSSLYASAGFSVMNRSASFEPKNSILRKQSDYMLDARIGAAGHIGIGWLFLEGRLAPRIFSTKNNGGLETLHGPVYGVNAGIRFLMNRHPRCSN